MSISFIVNNQALSVHLLRALSDVTAEMDAADIAKRLSPDNDAVKNLLEEDWFTEDLYPGEALGLLDAYHIDDIGGELVHSIEFDTDGHLELILGMQDWFDSLVRVMSQEERFKAVESARSEAKRVGTSSPAGSDAGDSVDALKQFSLYPLSATRSISDYVSPARGGRNYYLYIAPQAANQSRGSLLNAQDAAKWVQLLARALKLDGRVVAHASRGDHDVDEYIVDVENFADVLSYIRGSGFFMPPSEFTIKLRRTEWLQSAVAEMLETIQSANEGFRLKNDDVEISVFDFGMRLGFRSSNLDVAELPGLLENQRLVQLIGSIMKQSTGVDAVVMFSTDPYLDGSFKKRSSSHNVSGTEFDTESITNLLKHNNADLSAVKANKILIQLGLLEEKQRESTVHAGKIKKFKSLTKAGLNFGINKESFNNPEETSPHYYSDKFDQLLALIRSAA